MSTDKKPIDLVREFYNAVRAKDIDTIGRIIDIGFSPDVVVKLPSSLYYGGQYRGASEIKRLFTGLAHPKSAVNAETLVVEHIIGTEEYVASVLTFEWRGRGGGEPLRTGNAEWFFFRDGLITELCAYYEDTARCAALDATPKAAEVSTELKSAMRRQSPVGE